MKPCMAIIGLLMALSLSVAVLSPCRLQAHTLQDEALPNVGVDEKPGGQLPLDLTFTDQDGRVVLLGDFFTGGPVILTLNYYACPTLCPLVFRNLSDTITGIKGLSAAMSGLNFAATALHLAMALVMLLVMGRMWAGEAKGDAP